MEKMEQSTTERQYKPPYKPANFRPPSLSIVTVTPEMQKSLQDLRNSSNATLEKIVADANLDGYDEDDFEDYDDFDEDGLEHPHNRSIKKPSLVGSPPQLQQNGSAKIHVGGDDDDDLDSDEDEEDNEHRFYYKTPPMRRKSDGRPAVANGHANSGQQNPNQNNNKPIEQIESSLLRYVLNNNTNHNNSGASTPSGGFNGNQNFLSPNMPNFDSISAASFASETRKLPSILKHSNSREDIVMAPASPTSNQEPDAASIGDCSIGQSDVGSQVHSEHNQHQHRLMNYRMAKLLSMMYALVLIVVGAIITISDMSLPVNDKDHLFSIVTTLVGLFFLGFIHFDVQRHKSFVVRWEKKRKEAIEAPMKSANDLDSVSVTTAVIFNRNWLEDDAIDDEVKERLNSYKFLTGKHSGNFYLKMGMTLFCMGSIVHQGINVALQIYYFAQDVEECKNGISFAVYLIRCIVSFYQLYMAFKYSNLIINRHHYVVMFGLMHLLGTCMSFWFSTIIEEAMDGYATKIKDYHSNSSIPEDTIFVAAVNHHIHCSKNALSDFETTDAMPFLYPFSIEYNIILASVWYIVWTNIGSNDPAQLSHIREEINQDQHTGAIDVHYRSNITINADCHASNMGLFGGLFTLLLVMTTTIVFFTTIRNSDYKDIGIALYTAQFGFLTLALLATTPLAMRHTRRLNVVNHHHLDNSATAMDDLLLLVPLPFFYIHHTLAIYSEITYGSVNSWANSVIFALHLVQVTWQTPFLIDGIRRCANDRKLRFKKPGKGLITFAIIANVAMWILITLEIKSVDKYHSMPKYYGKFNWMIILDTCLPLMLFYRFHSSVCLSDMWQHAYEKDHH